MARGLLSLTVLEQEIGAINWTYASSLEVLYNPFLEDSSSSAQAFSASGEAGASTGESSPLVTQNGDAVLTKQGEGDDFCWKNRLF